jgi:hypothetical protein
MTLKELKGKYARLSNEIDELATDGMRNEARLMRLMNDLDQVHRELSELRLRTFSAPTLRDAVPRSEPVALSVVVTVSAPAAVSQSVPGMLSPALSMAG